MEALINGGGCTYSSKEYETLCEKVIDNITSTNTGHYKLKYPFLLKDDLQIVLNVFPNKNRNTSSVRLSGFGVTTEGYIGTVSNVTTLQNMLRVIVKNIYILTQKSKLSYITESIIKEDFMQLCTECRRIFVGPRGRPFTNKTNPDKLSKVVEELYDTVNKHEIVLPRRHQKYMQYLNEVQSKMKRFEDEFEDLNNRIYKDKNGMAARIRELEQYNQILLNYIELLERNMEGD